MGNLKAWSVAAVVLAVVAKAAPVACAQQRPHVVDLMSLIDVQKDQVNGTWKAINGAVVSDKTWCARLRIPYEPPEEYDYRIEFVRQDGNDCVAQMLQYGHHSCMWGMGGWDNTTCGITTIDGSDPNNKSNPSRYFAPSLLQNARKHVSLVQVRKGSIAGSIDGKVVSKVALDSSRFGITDSWSVGPDALGIGSWGSRVEFVKIEVTEISGAGKTLPHAKSDDHQGNAKVDLKKPEENAGASPPPSMARQAIPETTDLAGPDTPIKRNQSEIKALYVREQDSGEMLGLASELIATAAPGTSRGYTPVVFASQVGSQMTGVLDDVLRNLRLKYPKLAASRVDLSFEDRETPKDGGSIGAAIGTLLLSMVQGFEIDSKVAMTGDVTADGKLRPIGGVAAKLRGATAAGCNVAIVPAANYDQVVDAVVFEGPSLISEIQVIGAANLEEATAAARSDRDENLSRAIDDFGSIAELLKKYPARIHTKDVVDKLTRITQEAPNHLSAKLLLLVAQNKTPQKLSATASLYYTFVPVQPMLPALFEPSESGKAQTATPALVQQGLINLRKLRAKVDPKVFPLLDSLIDWIQTLNAINSGRRPLSDLEPKRKRFLDTLQKMSTDRPLMEKMLREGV